MLTNRVFFVFVFMALLPFTSFAADEIGIFLIVKGDVKIDTDGKKVPAKVTGKIFKGSTVEAGPDSRAKIAMADKSIVHISPDSKVKIAEFTTGGANRNVKLELSHGKIRNEVQGSYGDKNKYEVKTPTAVAGVRGTDFLVKHEVKSNTTEVVTFKGSVELTMLKNGVPSGPPILIKKDEKSTAAPDKTLDTPQPVKADEKKQLDSDTKVVERSGPVGGAPAPGDTNPKNDSSKGDSGKGNADSTGGKGDGGSAKRPESGRTRIGDTKDTAPESFDQLPKGGTPPPPKPPVINPISNLPTTNPRLNDAIRDKTDKSTVIIKPQQVPPTGTSNR